MRERQGGVRVTNKFTPPANAILASNCVKKSTINSHFIVRQNQIPFAFIKHVYPLNLIDGFKDYLIEMCTFSWKNTHSAQRTRQRKRIQRRKMVVKKISTKQISTKAFTRVHIL